MDNEVRLFINERFLIEKVKLIYYRDNRAILAVNGYEYFKRFRKSFNRPLEF